MSEIPCLVSSDPHERQNDLATVLRIDSVKLQWPVKMRPSHTWTKRPRGALLELDPDLKI